MISSILFPIILFFYANPTQKKPLIPDPEFLTITIDGVTWTAEDVHVPIPGSKCLDSTCQQVLYSWKEAKQLDEQLTGWRLPTWKDWRKLERHFGSGLVEEHGLVRVGKEVKAGLNITSFPGVYSEGQLGQVGEENAYWVKPATEVVEADGSVQIFQKHFYGPKSEKKDQIWPFISDAESNLKCSVRLIKVE
ncbi:MAG: hypothetical protein SFV55_01270 [Haliscomenobacter sp.]|uniref:hypothetical protein n=1 Tax=Haliscomenobacter sp. TaxID=2717303 RepID=UPI0029B5129A|nr:hypothetical protein [Haliscomenobacter sp.]MDX2067019.1 hypothetical protein [Haliscomenobacter sp.]